MSDNRINLGPVYIETERLLIRPYEAIDFDNSVLLYGDKDITKYFDFGVPRDTDEVRELIDYYSKCFTKYLGLFSIFLKNNLEFIGHMDCMPILPEHMLEVGFIIHKNHHNKGFAAEMLQAFIFKYIPIIKNSLDGFICNTLMLTTHPKNYATIKLAEKLGMHFEHELIRFNQPRLRYTLTI